MSYKVIVNPFDGNLQLVNSTSGGGTGNVTGIPPTNINAITRWASTDGTQIKNSPGTNVQDSGAIEAQGFISKRAVVGVTVTVNTGETWIAPSVEMGPGGVIVLGSDAQLLIL